MRSGGGQRISFRFFVIFVTNCIVAASVFAPIVLSSSSGTNRNTYNVYNYDQTTPQFTPDGRLLQVEYASSAADLSPPLVILESYSPGKEHSHEENSSYPCTVLMTIPRQALSPQNRIVIVNENVENQPSRSYCVAMSGILSDSLALLQAGMKVAAQDSLRYQRSFDMESLTQALADECQSRVFAGGLRPYGSTLLLCGYNDDDQIISEKELRAATIDARSCIFQTDPSGGILQHVPNHQTPPSTASVGAFKSKKLRRKPSFVSDDEEGVGIQSRVRCIVGGTPSLQRQLIKRIDQAMMELEHQKGDLGGLTLAKRISSAANVLQRETNTNSDTSDRSGSGSTKFSDQNGFTPLEIVVVSPIHGCHRLDVQQLRSIQELMNDK